MEPPDDLEANLSPSQAPATVAAVMKPETIMACMVAVAVVIAGAFIVFYPQDTLLPTFSVSVDAAGFGGFDGGPTTPANATFDLTLHGVTRRRLIRTLGICNERGTLSISYAGAVLAWGHVPKFCVPAQGQKHVRMVALGADVELSDELRGRLASERLSRTAALDVNIMLDRQRYLSCRVKPDEDGPSPCKVFMLQWVNVT